MTTDPRVATGLDELLALPTQRAEEFVHWTPEPTYGRQGPTDRQTRTAGLTDAETGFLRAVVDNPGRPSSQYAKLAGIGTHQAIAIRKHLVDQGYLREHRVSTGARGRTSIVLEPSPKAADILSEGSK